MLKYGTLMLRLLLLIGCLRRYSNIERLIDRKSDQLFDVAERWPVESQKIFVGDQSFYCYSIVRWSPQNIMNYYCCLIEGYPHSKPLSNYRICLVAGGHVAPLDITDVLSRI